MGNKSRTEYSFLNIVAGLGGYIINTVLGFVCRMVFARCLSESYLGISGLLTNFLSMLSLAELGIGGAIVYSLYKPLAENDEEAIASWMKVYQKVYFAIGVIVAVAGICLIPVVKLVVGDSYTIPENLYLIYGIYLLNSAGSYFFSYRSALLTAAQKNYLVIGTSYIITSLQSVIQIILLLVCKTYMPYLIVQTIGTFLFNIIISVVASKKYPLLKRKDVKPISREQKKTLFTNVKALTLYKLSGVLVNNTDYLVITYFSGLGITGLASNYVLLINTLNTAVSQLFGALVASVGNLNAKEDEKHQYAFFKALNLSNFWVFGWAAIGIVFVSSDLVQLCFGNKYVLDSSIPLMLAINFYMVGMQNAILTFKSTKGLFKYGKYILLFTAMLNIAGDIFFGKIWGLFGIYFATALARLLTNTWYEPYAVYKYAFGVKPIEYFKKYFGYLIVLLISGGICFVLCRLVQFNLIISIILKVLICSIVPNGVFYLFYHKKPEFEYIKSIIKRVKSIVVNLLKKIKK